MYATTPNFRPGGSMSARRPMAMTDGFRPSGSMSARKPMAMSDGFQAVRLKPVSGSLSARIRPVSHSDALCGRCPLPGVDAVRVKRNPQHHPSKELLPADARRLFRKPERPSQVRDLKSLSHCLFKRHGQVDVKKFELEEPRSSLFALGSEKPKPLKIPGEDPKPRPPPKPSVAELEAALDVDVAIGADGGAQPTAESPVAAEPPSLPAGSAASCPVLQPESRSSEVEKRYRSQPEYGSVDEFEDPGGPQDAQPATAAVAAREGGDYGEDEFEDEPPVQNDQPGAPDFEQSQTEFEQSQSASGGAEPPVVGGAVESLAADGHADPVVGSEGAPPPQDQPATVGDASEVPAATSGNEGILAEPVLSAAGAGEPAVTDSSHGQGEAPTSSLAAGFLGGQISKLRAQESTDSPQATASQEAAAPALSAAGAAELEVTGDGQVEASPWASQFLQDQLASETAAGALGDGEIAAAPVLSASGAGEPEATDNGHVESSPVANEFVQDASASSKVAQSAEPATEVQGFEEPAEDFAERGPSENPEAGRAESAENAGLQETAEEGTQDPHTARLMPEEDAYDDDFAADVVPKEDAGYDDDFVEDGEEDGQEDENDRPQGDRGSPMQEYDEPEEGVHSEQPAYGLGEAVGEQDQEYEDEYEDDAGDDEGEEGGEAVEEAESISPTSPQHSPHAAASSTYEEQRESVDGGSDGYNDDEDEYGEPDEYQDEVEPDQASVASSVDVGVAADNATRHFFDAARAEHDGSADDYYADDANEGDADTIGEASSVSDADEIEDDGIEED